MSESSVHSRIKKPPSALTRLLDRVFPHRREHQRLARHNDRLESFFKAVPIEYCGWDPAGTQAISSGFARLLEIDHVDTFRHIRDALAPGDAASLEGLFDRLEKNGEAFDVGVRTLQSHRSLRIFGRRGEVPERGHSFTVLWVMDITDYAEAAIKNFEAIRQMERKDNEWRSVLNALPFPLWVRNEKLDLAWCNKSYARAVDDSSATVIAEQKELVATGAVKNSIGQRILAQRARGSLAAETVRGHIIIENQARLMDVTEIPLPLEKKSVGVAIDVSREEEINTAFARLAKAQRELIEQLPIPIAVFDHDTRLEFYNPGYEQLTTMPGSWLDSRPRMVEMIDKLRELRKLPEQADYKQFKQTWLARFTSLLEPYEEIQYLPDGSALRVIAIPRPQGGLVMTFEDVSSRLHLETSYNTLVAVQQETLDNLTAAIAVFGEDGRLRIANLAYMNLWSLPPDLSRQTPHITAIMDQELKAFAENERAVARETLMTNALEREPRRGRLILNSEKIIEYSVVPLPDGNMLNAYFDITDSVRVQQALTDKNAALEEAERLKSDFLANVSYQLRTPLNAIIGFAELLHQQYFGALNERQLEYTSNMIEAGQRLVSLVNDILDLANIEAGTLQLYPTDVDLKTLAAHVIHLTEAWAQKQKISMVVEAPDEPLTVHGDERRIKQVFLNLISNAINYSPSGGRVTVTLRRDDRQAVVDVRDTGIGIARGDLSRIFTPFERAKNRKINTRGGAGLGLSLVRSIVRLHGGDVTIESEEGVGTHVTFRLPLKK